MHRDHHCLVLLTRSRNGNAIANRGIVQDIACHDRPIHFISPIRTQDVKDSTKDQPSLSTTEKNVPPAHDMRAVAPATGNYIRTVLGTQSPGKNPDESIRRTAGKEDVVRPHNSVRKGGDEVVMSGHGYWNVR
jgi:hypothetical protein